jgi:acyl-CoA synthetase (AMP-forming)/AMP-acid ligase II
MAEPLDWHSSSFAPTDPALISQSLPAALAQTVSLGPKHTAILIGNNSFSFEDLAQRASGLADAIRRSSAPHGPVALLQSPGLDFVAAWFACGLANRPFLLLEPSHPPARLKELICAASAPIVLCDQATFELLPSDTPAERLQPNGCNLPWRIDDQFAPDEPAMIFPTSGSTGRPKLVAYSSQTLQVKVQASRYLMRIPPSARVMIAGSHGNYGFLHHALAFLFSGGTLCLNDVRTNGLSGLLDAIERFGVRHVRFTPSLFRTVARQPEARDALRGLEAVRFSGELLLRRDLELAQAVLDPSCLIQNVYGSTESTLFIWSLGDELDPVAATVPIGQVYPYSSYALKPLQDAPDDIGTGELILRSAFHALGDLNAGVVDSGRFPAAQGSASERVYATGDIVRRLPGGGLVLLGRSNRMVKIRGQRIFLAELENHLRAIPGVTGAAAVNTSEADETALYGFITIGDGVKCPPNIRAWLMDRLPEFMLPRQVTVIDRIPLLPGGKVDYRALISLVSQLPINPTALALPKGDYGRLTAIWRSVLGWGAHDPENDFYALGGDSLKLIQLTLAVEREFLQALPIEAFKVDPTLAGLANSLDIAVPKEAVSARSPLELRPFCSARLPSQGIALGMPGWHGSALITPYCEADLFSDYDIWSADVSLPDGNMLEKCRWWQAAQDIAERLRQANAPAPRLIFGYSIAGSIAWLVGRLLAGTPQAPEFIVMIDAAPMHRLPHYGNKAISELADTIAAERLPAVIHIRRASLEQVGIATGSAQLWRPSDNIVRTLDVPTIAHLELGQGSLLRLTAEWLKHALAHTPDSATVEPIEARIETPGGRLHRMIAAGDARRTTEFREMFDRLTDYTKHYSEALYLVLRDGTRHEAQQFIQHALLQHPGSRLLHYATRRIQRSPMALCPRKGITESFLSIQIVENALSTHHTAPTTWKVLNLLKQAVDIVGAVLCATPARLKLMIHRWTDR